MNHDIEVIDSKHFATTVTEELVASILDVLDEQESCSFVLSGGSTPAQVYRRLGRPPFSEEVDWGRMKIFWGDDRWVPSDSEQSNYRMANETFLSAVATKGAKTFPIDTSLSTPTKAAMKYETIIKEQGYYTDGNTPSFDIVLLGMGTDMHTASLFPGDKDLDTDKLSVAVVNPKDKTERVSLSAKSLFHAKKIFFLVAGEDKSDALSAVLHNQDLEPIDAPATLYRNATGRVTWFCDSPAASKLGSS